MDTREEGTRGEGTEMRREDTEMGGQRPKERETETPRGGQRPRDWDRDPEREGQTYKRQRGWRGQRPGRGEDKDGQMGRCSVQLGC